MAKIGTQSPTFQDLSAPVADDLQLQRRVDALDVLQQRPTSDALSDKAHLSGGSLTAKQVAMCACVCVCVLIICVFVSEQCINTPGSATTSSSLACSCCLFVQALMKAMIFGCFKVFSMLISSEILFFAFLRGSRRCLDSCLMLPSVQAPQRRHSFSKDALGSQAKRLYAKSR